LYAHFDSKEAIFHALLQRSMQLPTLDVDAVLAGADTARELAQRLLQPMCNAVQEPSLMALTRILLTEGTARPRCRTGGATSMPRSALLTQVLQRGVGAGSAAPRAHARARAGAQPLVHWMVQHISAGQRNGWMRTRPAASMCSC
jgi:AcrR family transcriptional regulator